MDKNFVEFFEACYKYQVSSRLVMVVKHALCRNLALENYWYHYQKNKLIQDKLEYSMPMYNDIPPCVFKEYIQDNFEKVIHLEDVVWEMKRNLEFV